jgi:periplasmic protein TonB
MKKSILFFIILFSSVVFSQETIQIKNKKTNEVYFVLKSDKKTKHGKYQKFNSDRKIVTEGYYKNGKKDSLWIHYQSNGHDLSSKGNYLAEKKIGVWELYDGFGELEQKYDYTKNEMVYFKCNPSHLPCRIFLENETLIDTLECTPIYKGGVAVIYQTVIHKIVYPELSRELGIQGTVYINFTIDSLGNTSNHYVLRGIGAECDEEALRVVKLIPDNWIPGFWKGSFVNCEYTLPITYRIQ